MDLISQLTATLGVDDAKAQAVAGAVLGRVQAEVAESGGDEAAERFSGAVPELSGWQEKAASLLGGGDAGSGGAGGLVGALGGGGAGGLLGAAAGALGGEDARNTAAIVALLGRFDIDASKAAMVAPLVVSFLKERLDPKLLDTVLSAAPLLAGGGGDAGGGLGAAAGMLGGLFGKD